MTFLDPPYQKLYDEFLKPFELVEDLDWNTLSMKTREAFHSYLETIPKPQQLQWLQLYKKFARNLIEINPQLLAACGMEFDEMYEKYKEQQLQRPRVGGVLIDPTFTKVVLIHFKFSTTFTFPQGKLKDFELPSVGARRKITEFTGYDCGEDLQLENPIEFVAGNVSFCYFYVHNVKENTKFEPLYKDDVAKVVFCDLNKLSIRAANDRKFLHFSVKHCLNDVKTYCMTEKMKVGFSITSGSGPSATSSISEMKLTIREGYTGKSGVIMINCQQTKVLLFKNRIVEKYIFPMLKDYGLGTNAEMAKTAMEDYTGYKRAGLVLDKSITRKYECLNNTFYFVDNVPESFNFESSFGVSTFVDINRLKDNRSSFSSGIKISPVVFWCLNDILRHVE